MLPFDVNYTKMTRVPHSPNRDERRHAQPGSLVYVSPSK